ncbi:hypothetical protein SSPO_069840 [Streptomyces antimycoticus]|uniref:N-acetyltransferase domain-containing protein n=1 Tax=Streptomyces antimycoticus TaxID=68175 RepID=A0A499V7M8_9ACTN|nr:hypothetical protein SSPO_069840 [Streptomyces antimycoticus]
MTYASYGRGSSGDAGRVAERLTRTLMEKRDEDLVVLLVDPEHSRVQALYESWGFRKVGERQPFPDSPVYAVMLAELPLK